jgi:hypothetical protein
MSISIAIKKAFINLYTNSLGWRTDRKLVVIESDDWGSIRMPSIEVYNKFLSLGFPVDKLSYLKYDSLESNDDLEALFEVLTTFKDSKGNHPVITANTIMTNPDFDKIRQSGFTEYHYELFTETLKRYPQHDRVFDLYKQGIDLNIFYPQLHGREHLNVNRWMKALQEEKSNIKLAFDYGFYDIGTTHTEISNESFVDTFSLENRNELIQQENSIKEAAQLFKLFFGYDAKTFIAPCYIWRPELEKAFMQNGFRVLQSGPYQLIPEIGRVNSFNKKLHYTGQKSKNNIKYTVRNCFFEPSSKGNPPAEIENCLIQINNSFRHKKPAIITSHRLNYIGLIDLSLIHI